MTDPLFKGEAAPVAGGARNPGGLIGRTRGAEEAEVAVPDNGAATKPAAVAWLKSQGMRGWIAGQSIVADGGFTTR